MTTYNRSDRYSWRRYARRLVWRINYVLAFCLVALALLSQPAQAAPRCPGGGQPDTRGRCVYSLPTMTCAWPLRLARHGNVAFCWQPDSRVQP